MNIKKLVYVTLAASTCFAGAAAAQDFDQRGPNVMPAPRHSNNYSNNLNTYNNTGAQSRNGPNVMQAPESLAQTPRAPRTESAPATQPEEQAPQESIARGTGPNINGDSTSMPTDPARNGRRADAVPGCAKCVAI